MEGTGGRLSVEWVVNDAVATATADDVTDADPDDEGNKLARRSRVAAEWSSCEVDVADMECRGDRAPASAWSIRSRMAVTAAEWLPWRQAPSIDIVIERPRDSEAIEDNPDIAVVCTIATTRRINR